jgi:hypothetical protein
MIPEDMTWVPIILLKPKIENETLKEKFMKIIL